MDGITIELTLFLMATFAGAFVAGLSGFAFGLVAASLWLYVLTPLQSASLIIGFGLLVQGYSIISADYRGSTGYGRGLYEQIDYGGREVDDVYLAGQWMLETYSFLDPKRGTENGRHAAQVWNDVPGELGTDHFAQAAHGLDESLAICRGGKQQNPTVAGEVI